MCWFVVAKITKNISRATKTFSLWWIFVACCGVYVLGVFVRRGRKEG